MNTNQLITKEEYELLKSNPDKLNELASSDHFKKELKGLLSLNPEQLWPIRIIKKIDELLEATMVDKFWNEIPDNQSQLKALELLLKVQWMDVGWWRVNLIFNMPAPNEPMRY